VLIVAAALIACVLVFDRRNSAAALPVTERLWFHSTITWPVVVKAAFGPFVFGSGANSTGTSFTLVTYGPAIIMAIVLALIRLARPGATPFLPAIVYGFVALLGVPYLFEGGTLLNVIPVVLVLPLMIHSEARILLSSWFREARFGLLSIAAALALTGLISRGTLIGDCRADKCTVFGDVLISPLTNNGNFAGISMVIVFAIACFGMKPIPTLILAVSVVSLVDLSGSRSADIAALTTAVISIAVSFRAESRSVLVTLAFLGGLLGSLTTALVAFPQTFATDRGALWIQARRLITDNPFVGWGPNYWTTQVNDGYFIANYSPHNFWLEIAVSGGAVSLVALIVAGVLLLRSPVPSIRFAVMLPVAVLLIVGMLEAPVQPGNVALAPFAPLIPLMIGSTLARRQLPLFSSSKNQSWLTPSHERAALIAE
jgi:hypothetical protein